MSWKDIVRKGHCMASKMDSGCDCSECMKKERESMEKGDKPDYIDIDGDGNKTESMKQAAKDKKKKKGGRSAFTAKD